jgi:hypothetical protein
MTFTPSPRAVHQYMIGRRLANLIFYCEGTPAAIRMTPSEKQPDDILEHAEIDLRNPLIPTKPWLLDLAKNREPRPGGPSFIVGTLGNDHNDPYDDIITAGNHLPDARPWDPDKPRYTFRDHLRLALRNVLNRL